MLLLGMLLEAGMLLDGMLLEAAGMLLLSAGAEVWLMDELSAVCIGATWSLGWVMAVVGAC